MATSRFKQINAFVARQKEAPHAAHLSWMQRFQERVGTLIVTELGEVFLFIFADIPSHALGGVRNFVARLRAQRVEHGLVPFATCGKLRKRPAVQICPSAPKEKTTLDWVVFSFSAGRSQLRCSATSPLVVGSLRSYLSY